MIESTNFRTGIGGSFLRTTPAALLQMPQRLDAPSRNTSITAPMHSQSLPRIVEKNRHQWLVQTDLFESESLVKIEPQVNPRQWLLSGNPRLASLITQTIGDRWMTHLEDLQQLAPMADHPLFQLRWRAIKQANKQVLANELYQSQGIRIDVNSLFDLQLQPMVGHQRQLLNILHIITLFNQIKQNPGINILPRTFIFGMGTPQHSIATEHGASSRSDCQARLEYHHEQQETDSNLATLALIKSLAKILAADPDVNGKLQVVYVPESAGLTSQMYAAADLTQQIATAAMEDIDLSQLRATINGVVSIGSLGKTNYWLQQIVGEHNCFRFGLAVPEIALFKEYGYDPYNYYKYYPQIRQAIDYLLAGYFTPNDPSLCRSIIDTLLGTDEQMVLADYIFYAACQHHVSDTYRQASSWTQMSIMNVAGVK